jgi:hypothetical protein
VAWAGTTGAGVEAGEVVVWSAPAVVDLGLFTFWYATVRPSWVESAARDSARQLYETVNIPDTGGPAAGAG